MLSRRNFLAAAAMAPVGLRAASSEFPRYDLHCHLDKVVTLDKVLEISKRLGVRFGVVEHAGRKEYTYPNLIWNDELMRAYIARLEGKPVWKGIQAEGSNWMTAFSKDVVAQLDFVLSDAMTMTGPKGEQQRIWLPTFQIPDAEAFMERYVDYHVEVMRTEPLDILANTTFLPDAILPQYDKLWTEERMKKVIRAAVEYNVALEINSRYKLPKLPFLKLAKKAGAKFSIGSNIHGLDVGKIEYSLEAAKEAGLKPKDFFEVAKPGKKPIQIRKFA
jgi:histidinol phosphatase-like PHP family hydrolase